MNTDELEIGYVIRDNIENLDFTLAEPLKHWVAGFEGVWAVECVWLGRFHITEHDLRKPRYELISRLGAEESEEGEPTQEYDEPEWHDAKVGDLPDSDGWYEVKRQLFDQHVDQENLYYSDFKKGFFDTMAQASRLGAGFYVDQFNFFKWREIRYADKPEPPQILNDERVNGPIWPLSSHGGCEVGFTIPPQKITGLVWVPECDIIINLNEICQRLN